MLVPKFICGLVALAIGTAAAALAWQSRIHVSLRAQADAEAAAAATALRSLETQIAAQADRLAQAEARLSSALNTAKTTTAARPRSPAAPTAERPIDADEIARSAVAEGTQLSKAGDAQAALDLYLEAYRRVRPLRPGSPACQRLASAMKHLGRTFPIALTALEQLRDDAMAQLKAEPARRGELSWEIAQLNDRLGQADRTLALFDALPPGDIQRGGLAMVARDAFIQARRYDDALLGKAFGQMLGRFEAAVQHFGKEPDPMRQAMIRKSIVDQTLTDIEVLGGAGKTDETRQLTEKLLAFDNTQATRGQLEERLTRAKGAGP